MRVAVPAGADGMRAHRRGILDHERSQPRHPGHPRHVLPDLDAVSDVDAVAVAIAIVIANQSTDACDHGDGAANALSCRRTGCGSITHAIAAGNSHP
jgi:hypothetical protein